MKSSRVMSCIYFDRLKKTTMKKHMNSCSDIANQATKHTERYNGDTSPSKTNVDDEHNEAVPVCLYKHIIIVRAHQWKMSEVGNDKQSVTLYPSRFPTDSTVCECECERGMFIDVGQQHEDNIIKLLLNDISKNALQPPMALCVLTLVLHRRVERSLCGVA